MSAEQKKPFPNLPSEMPIHFIKSNHFRVIHASGIWFGADPQGNVHLTFYNERTTIPQKVVIKIDPSGQFAGEEESKRESKQGLVREIEADVVMTPTVALGLLQMFQDNVKAAFQAQEATQKAKMI